MLITNASHDINLLEKGIEKLLCSAFFTSNSLYLLGSGVSSRHSKMEAALVQTTVEKYLWQGSIDIDDKTSSSLATTLLWRYMASHEDAFLKELSRKIPDGFIKAIVNEEYAQLTPLCDNPEYQVFLLAKKWSTIIDMNYEGFSTQYLGKHHYVISPHGVATPKLAKFTKEIRRNIAMYNLDMSKYSDIKLYPGEKQTNNIIAPYRPYLCSHVFPNLLWLVITGYSFANTGHGLNDIFLYELIKEYVEYYKKIQIIIINPNPESVAVLFEKELDRVTILPTYWNSLTRAIQVNKGILHKNYLRSILHDYYRFLER